MTNDVPYREEHRKMAADLLKETDANDGLAPVDIEKFWEDQKIAGANPFGRDIPQVAFGCRLSGECVFDELGVEEDHWRYKDDEQWRLSLNKQYNDKAEKIVGRRWLGEKPGDLTRRYPAVKGLHDVFEAENVWHGQSWWLQQSATNEDELKALLDRVDERDIRSFILPENWPEEKERLMALGVKPGLYRGQRGPVTFATSIYGPENLIFLIMDNPELAGRLRDTILRVMLEIARVRDEEAGYTPETAPHGWYWCDDNCVLLNPEMYRFFAYPIHKGIFDRYSPNPEDERGQHSDSGMGHLLPILSELKLNSTNFGPTVPASEIRKHLPNAVIRGQLAPFTYSRNERENIILEFLRDFEMIGDTRGLVFATAGSINNGTRLTSMRLVMAAIQRYGRYTD
jgi:uroporphyrinogen decarboxylase